MAKEKKGTTGAAEAAEAAKINAGAPDEQSSQDEKNEGSNQPAPAAAPASPPETTQAPPAEEKPEQLYSLDELELKFRLPGWQRAALLRLTGWAAGKKVSEAEYKTALDQLNSRRQGGGRY